MPINPNPTYGQGFARLKAESAFPEMWNNLIYATAMYLGPTGELQDWSGAKHPGVLTNMDVTDWIGDALDFPGVNEHVNMGTLGDFAANFATNLPSFSLWLKTTDTGSQWIFGTRNAVGETRVDVRINTDSNGANVTGAINGVIVDEDDNSMIFGVDTDTGISDGFWHNILIQFDGPADVAEIYVDGRQQTVVFLTQQTPDNFINFARDLIIGGFNDGGAPLSPFNGQMRQFLIFDKWLTPNQTQLLARIPKALFIRKSRTTFFVPTLPIHNRARFAEGDRL